MVDIEILLHMKILNIILVDIENGEICLDCKRVTGSYISITIKIVIDFCEELFLLIYNL